MMSSNFPPTDYDEYDDYDDFDESEYLDDPDFADDYVDDFDDDLGGPSRPGGQQQPGSRLPGKSPLRPGGQSQPSSRLPGTSPARPGGQPQSGGRLPTQQSRPGGQSQPGSRLPGTSPARPGGQQPGSRLPGASPARPGGQSQPGSRLPGKSPTRPGGQQQSGGRLPTQQTQPGGQRQTGGRLPGKSPARPGGQQQSGGRLPTQQSRPGGQQQTGGRLPGKSPTRSGGQPQSSGRSPGKSPSRLGGQQTGGRLPGQQSRPGGQPQSGGRSPGKSPSRPGGQQTGGRLPGQQSRPGQPATLTSKSGPVQQSKPRPGGAAPKSSPTRPASKSRPGGKPSTPPTTKKTAGKPTSRTRTRAKPSSLPLPGVQGMRIKERKPALPAREKPEIPPEPDWIKRIQARMPHYADELLAVFLIMIGLLSLFALLSPTSGDIGDVWARGLQKALGWGAYVVSTVIITAGALILAPKININVRLNWWRIIAGELFFVFLLAYTHAFIRWTIGGEEGRIEAFARAFEGHGGGVVGWAIQDVFHSLLGDFVTGVVLLGLLAATGGVMAGFRRRHLVTIFGWLNLRLMKIAARLDPGIKVQTPPATAQEDAQPAQPSPAAGTPSGPPNMEEVMKGRPSIVTGMRADAPEIPALPPRPEAATPEEKAQEEKPAREIRYRFTVAELRDKKKIRKRSDKLPPLDLLDVTDFERPTENEINLAATIIEETVEDFGMKVEVVGVKAGPTVTQYAVQPFANVEKDGKKVVQRVRVTKVAGLAKDISLALQAPRVRIQAPVPGTNYIGVEVPNARPGVVSLRPVIESEQFFKYGSPLTLGLGREVDGRPFAADLAAMPHLLIGGTTGSGKSVCITSIATCLITNNTPDDLRLIMIDPKMVELVRFNGLPHLLGHVEVQLDRIIGVLRWLTREMDHRYKLMEEDHARNITVYNKGKRKSNRLPYIVVLIDELAELMSEFPDETEHLITRLAQMARATGIHLVVATQRPSTDVLTGLIKANFPARISFTVASGVDSRVVIDAVGAEDLISKGDMLFQGSDAAGPIRLQGCFVNDNELDRVVEFWRRTWKDAKEEVEAPWERALARSAVLEETDTMIEKAIRLVQQEGHASASLLQRKLGIGYPRAGRLVDTLYMMEVIGEEESGGRNRKLRIGRDVDPTAYIIDWRAGR